MRILCSFWGRRSVQRSPVAEFLRGISQLSRDLGRRHRTFGTRDEVLDISVGKTSIVRATTHDDCVELGSRFRQGCAQHARRSCDVRGGVLSLVWLSQMALLCSLGSRQVVFPFYHVTMLFCSKILTCLLAYLLTCLLACLLINFLFIHVLSLFLLSFCLFLCYCLFVFLPLFL